MYKTLEEGIAGGAMGAYTQFSASERVAIINYVRSFKPDIYPDITTSDIQKLEKDYDLSEELAKKIEKNIIPIEEAMRKLVKQNAAKVKKVLAAEKKAMAASGEGAKLLQSHTYNMRRALTMLNNSGIWKSSAADFNKIVMSSLGHNGFKSEVGALSSEEWKKLQAYLKTLL